MKSNKRGIKIVKDGFREARKGLTEETRKLIKEWSKKDLEDFTEYLYKNRQKDRRGKNDRSNNFKIGNANI